MKSIYKKLAAGLAFIIGAMAIFAGGQVLLGKTMNYYVIGWLPLYNFSLGLISCFITAVLLWKGSKLALPFTIVTLFAHSTVLLIIQTVYREVVAPDSIRAMMVRIVVWLVINFFVYFQKQQSYLQRYRRNK